MALVDNDWRRDVVVAVAEDGRIHRVRCGVEPTPGDRCLAGRPLLPAPVNFHCHGFQRTLAGRT